MEGEITWHPVITQTETAIKNCSETTRMVETAKFYLKLFMFICTKENFSYPSQVFFTAGASLSLLLDTIDTSEPSFFDIIPPPPHPTPPHHNETKFKQQVSQNAEEKLLYWTHCHKCLK